MRIDKFLKVSRIIKRRQIAKAFCDKGRVEINGKVVKASEKVKVGDKISVTFGGRISSYIVKEIVNTSSKADANNMIEEV